jgi:sphingolipid delta-4 desaturase
MTTKTTTVTRELDPESKINPLTQRKGAAKAYTASPQLPFENTDWKARNKNDFHWVHSDEPHATRRKEILSAHPEIKKLFGPEPLTAVITITISLMQLWVASWITTQSWWLIALVGYCFSCTVNHTLQLANHEISHNLVFENLTANMVLGIVANLVTGIPSSVTFRMYHMDHHQYQGIDSIDTDIPSDFELRVFRTRFLKFIWMIGQSFAYGFRPVFTAPKAVTKFQVLNGVVCIAFDLWVWWTFGKGALFYLIACTFLGLGLHPSAGHFIAEHYEFVKGYETYSYYGIMNYVNFNVGYHNEHHDFPKIAWSRLPLVRKIAPEWYEHLPHHDSYLKVIWHYIMDEGVGPWSRIKRAPISKQKQM